MEQSDIEDAAMFLLHLHTQKTQIGGFPGEFSPKTVEEAYDIQDAMHRFAGWELDVLKVGCTSEIAQQVLGIPHPIGGRIPVDGVFADGATIPRALLNAEPLLECEIAMRLDSNGKVEACAPAIELVNSRFKDTSKVSGPSIVADNSAGAGVVLGDALPIEHIDDFSQLAVSLMSDDGTEIAKGSGAALLGGPQASIAWTLEHEANRGRTIDAGTWIITGTCTGLTPTEFGKSYTADFGALGTVSLNLDS